MFKIIFIILAINNLNESKLIKGSDFIVRKFKQYNINEVFGYPGGCNLELFDNLYQNNISIISNSNEQCLGHSAQAYSKTSNKMAVVITTSGPGLTNIITPLQDAMSDGISFLAISGQVNSNKIGTSAFQECDASNLTKPCTKFSKLIKTPEELEQNLDLAIKILKTPRYGPVHLDICSNVFDEYYNYKEENLEIKSNKIDDFNKINEDEEIKINEIYNKLMSSKKPIIIVGRGAIESKNNIRKLTSLYNIPICSTLHGLGVINSNDNNYLGMIGMHGTVQANKAVHEADLILGIGNRFDDRTIGNINFFAKNAKKNTALIHIDNSQEKIDEVKKIINPNYSVKISSDKFVKILLNKFSYTANREKWFNKINNWSKLNPKINKNTLNIPLIISKLSSKLNNVKSNNNEYLITTGVGVHQMQTAQYFSWIEPNNLVTSGSLGTMGVGLPFAIGCQLANPDKNVILIDGDGSFQMTCSDLITVSKYNLPIKIIIMDNKNLQMVSNWQEEFYSSRFVNSKLVNPDFVKLAESMGIKGIKCNNISELDNVLNYMLKYKKPILIHCLVESTKCLPFVPSSNPLNKIILK